MTRGVFLYHSRAAVEEIFKTGLLQHKTQLWSPHFLALVSSTYLIRKIDELRVEEIDILGRVEKLSGFHEYEKASKRQEVVAVRAPMDNVDLGRLSVMMSGSAANLARLERNVETIERFLKFIQEPDPISFKSSIAKHAETARDVADKASFLCLYVQYQSSDIKYLQKRVQIQLNAVSLSCSSQIFHSHVNIRSFST